MVAGDMIVESREKRGDKFPEPGWFRTGRNLCDQIRAAEMEGVVGGNYVFQRLPRSHEQRFGLMRQAKLQTGEQRLAEGVSKLTAGAPGQDIAALCGDQERHHSSVQSWTSWARKRRILSEGGAVHRDTTTMITTTSGAPIKADEVAGRR